EPVEWDGRFWDWVNLPFYVATYWSVFGVAFNLKEVMDHAYADIEKHKLDAERPLVLHREPILFHGRILILLSRFSDEVPCQMWSGRYYTRLFEGEYGDLIEFLEEFRKDLKGRRLELRDVLYHYPTCPDCIKRYKKMQVVIFGRVEDSQG
ncbi:MAG: hydrolase, partial [Candidatus Altiarchaeota archaeon]